VDARPSDAEMLLVRRCARVAMTEGGLRLKPFRLRWYEREQWWDVVAGFVDPSPAPPTMHLRVGQTPRDLAAVTFHELLHLHDVFTNAPHPRDELERRAERFSSRMMSRWRG
jgi:hypothetical protein